MTSQTANSPAPAETTSPGEARPATEQTQPAARKNLWRQKIYDFPRAEIDKAVERSLIQQSEKTKIRGFRAGKTPLSIMRKFYGKETLRRVLGDLSGRQFQLDMQSANERAATLPRFDLAEHGAPPSAYRIVCQYEAAPEIREPDFSGKSIKIPSLPIGEAEIDEMIEFLRTQHGEFAPTEDGAANGCRIRADFATSLADNPETATERGEGQFFILGAAGARPEITAALQGAKAGDNIAVELPAEDVHSDSDQAAQKKPMVMRLDILSVEKLKKAELGKELFERLGVGGEGMPGFRRMVEAHLRREVRVRLRNLQKRRALDALIAAIGGFPLPQTLLVAESENMLREAQEHLRMRGGRAFAKTLKAESFVHGAARRVALGLLFSDFQQRHDPKISDAEKEAKIDEFAEGFEDPERIKAAHRADPKRMEETRLAVLEDKVVEWVCARMEKADDPYSLSQLLSDPHSEGGEL